METKQTAMMQLKNDLLLYESQNPHCGLLLDVVSAINKKYLAIEKEQIREAWQDGDPQHLFIDELTEFSEYYYEETYGD